MNKKAFYASIRQTLFAGRLTQGVVDTTEAFLNEFQKHCISDYRIIAYTLASAYGESYNIEQNPQWRPVREGFTALDAGAVKHVKRLYTTGKITHDYSVKSPNGKYHFGRGHIQITHPDNYQRVGNLIGVDIYNYPEKTLELPVSVKIAVLGCYHGWFTGQALTNHITLKSTDFINARRVVNGKDRASDFADYAHNFYNALIEL